MGKTQPVILKEWDDLGHLVSEFLCEDDAAADARIKHRKDPKVNHGGQQPHKSTFTKEFPGAVVGPGAGEY